jgi:transcription elongation GreA/GreB family factor
LTTAAGQQRTASRLNKVRDAYDAVCASNGAAAEAGDNSVWHDNFDYEENQRQMHQLARRFRDLEDAMRRMEVVAAPSDPTKVCFGCVVIVETADGRSERLVSTRCAIPMDSGLG